MTIFTTLKSGILAGAAAMAAVTGIAAAQQISLDDVLRQAREERREAAQTNREREQQFLADRNQQQARLNTVRNQVNVAEAESDRIEAAFRANDDRIRELQTELEAQQGEFGELFGAARSAAADLAAQLEESIISAEYPGRAAELRATAEATTLPSVEELQFIYETHLEEMAAQAKVSSFSATIWNTEGVAASADMTRIGPYVAFSDGDYYIMKDVEGSVPRLTALAKQPAVADAVPNARSVASFSGDGYTEGTIDPTSGTLLGLYVDTPSLRERFDQGGPVGKAIAVIFLIGCIIGLFKLFTLFMTNSAVKGQVRRKTASRGNPLGRVMMAYESNPSADAETLALKLDDAVLREIPKLEGGLNLVKVFAAIAPLLGLLGTVVGMIVTFQQITLFGTGDPKIMAGGISTALVTTVLGLIAAIPLLLLHAF
ncbi:MAG: MotA/TolQ/ExbB proton channel family protein, partial [Pseudomonadota bacterium]